LQTTAYWLAIDDRIVEKLRTNGLWSNDPNQYGSTWPFQRDQARARDGYRCQVCGAPEQGRAHDVHHKIPFRTFSSASEANQLKNLITLCPACHKKVENVVRVRSGLAGLAYVLRNLAPLYLMCDIRDLGIHSDPQSLLAEGKPMVVVYDNIPEGIGFSERLYEIHGELLTQAFELINNCECTGGCPSVCRTAVRTGSVGKLRPGAID
jgi:DEAD/DEAH box helicase domain-containing protein